MILLPIRKHTIINKRISLRLCSKLIYFWSSPFRPWISTSKYLLCLLLHHVIRISLDFIQSSIHFQNIIFRICHCSPVLLLNTVSSLFKVIWICHFVAAAYSDILRFPNYVGCSIIWIHVELIALLILDIIIIIYFRLVH